MITTGSLFSQTLQDITNTKLAELAKKRKTFEEGRKLLLEKIEKEPDGLTMLSTVADGVKSCFDVAVSGRRVVRRSTTNPHLEIDLNNLSRFLQQARYDPSVSSKVMEQWKQSFLRHLDIQSLKFSFASLYGQLTTEWLQRKQSSISKPGHDDAIDDFEHVSSGKKLQSRVRWEQTVFESASVDEAAIVHLFHDIFDTSSEDRKELKQALDILHRRVELFEETMASASNFTSDTLRWTIAGLIASDLLTEERRAVLKDFADNQVIINEIADVLNMRMTTLDAWSWGEEVPLEQRRQLNGSYNIYMHEDLLQAIFLQYIGVKWSVLWKRAFTELRKASGGWKSPRTSIPLIDRKRRNHYLGEQSSKRNVQAARRRIYRESYFVSRLLDSETQQILNVDGDEEAEIHIDDDEGVYATQPPGVTRMTTGNKAPRKQFSGKRHRKILNDDDYVVPDVDDEDHHTPDGNRPKNPMEAKQGLLHLLSTEIMIKTRVHGEISCFRSHFDNFYPSLPHLTILSALKYFGVSDKWLLFFKKFLQVPLRFIGDSSASRVRKCGTPGSHVLSEVFGEVVLFSLDFKINQITEGELLWRLHDDIWFWSSDYGHCVKAWTTVTSFAETMGLCINGARTGSARMLQRREKGVRSMLSVPVETPLPVGQIRWGMLYLDPDSGRFEIDGKMVEQHIHELNRQLQDKSVFAWIQAWNTYATTFFTSNFGKPANCFGRQHVDSMLATHETIQRKIFSSSMNGNTMDSDSVVSFLRQTIEQRFGQKDIPDGYFFFPVELGGLEVQSPFIKLLQIQGAVLEHPEELLDAFEEAEIKDYRLAKQDYEEGNTVRNDTKKDLTYAPEDPDTFMPFEEYIRYREVLSNGFQGDLIHVFDKLLACPHEQSIDYDDEGGSIKIALNSLGNQSNLRGIVSNFYQMEPYWQWVAQLYGPEIIDRFGGLNFVDPGMLPIGMVSLFRSGKVNWED